MVPDLWLSRYMMHIMDCDILKFNRIGLLQSCRFCLGLGSVVPLIVPDSHVNGSADHVFPWFCGRFIGCCMSHAVIFVRGIHNV